MQICLLWVCRYFNHFKISNICLHSIHQSWLLIATQCWMAHSFCRTIMYYHIHKTKTLFKNSIEIIQCFQFKENFTVYWMSDLWKYWNLHVIRFFYKDASITRNQFFLFEIRSMKSPWQQNVLTDLYKEVLITVWW